MIGRRGFLRTLLIAPIAATLARHVPAPRPVHPLAAANRSLFNPSADLARQYRHGLLASDHESGIAIRYVHDYDVRRGGVNRLDLFYGAPVNPALACRVLG